MSFPTLLISMAIAVAAGLPTTVQAAEPGLQISPYMGGPVEMATAPNGAIANKRILDGIEGVPTLYERKPVALQHPVKGGAQTYLYRQGVADLSECGCVWREATNGDE